jgi:hypothetical protein
MTLSEQRVCDRVGSTDPTSKELVSRLADQERTERDRGLSGRSISEPGGKPELTHTVFGNRQKMKRSALVEAYDLDGLSNERIISVAQKEMAADQRPAEAKEAVDQRFSRPEHLKCRRKS